MEAEIAWHGAQPDWSRTDGVAFQLWIDGRDAELSALMDGSGDTSILTFWSEGGATARPESFALVPGRYETAANGSRAFLPNRKDAMEIPLE